ncbi:hypothetical protein BDR26DRAFT_891640 [Obelidium mucronatum]|nr:hypothetical protein BDR26DRAFT_891640 [Obelidium mucronatum]
MQTRIPSSFMFSFYLVVTFLTTQVAADATSDMIASVLSKLFYVLAGIFIIFLCCCSVPSTKSEPDPEVATAEVTPAPTHAIIVVSEAYETRENATSRSAVETAYASAPPTYEGAKNDAIIPLPTNGNAASEYEGAKDDTIIPLPTNINATSTNVTSANVTAAPVYEGAKSDAIIHL